MTFRSHERGVTKSGNNPTYMKNYYMFVYLRKKKLWQNFNYSLHKGLMYHSRYENLKKEKEKKRKEK